MKVIHMTNPKCCILFTAGFLKPIVVFPSNLTEWPEKLVRTAMLHELVHIKRHDYLTQYIARMICSIFWFIPFIWIAYSNLCREQEKACDLSVITRGVRPVDYASHMLNLACSTRHIIAFEGTFLSRGRKKVLEDRILSALRFKNPDKQSKGGSKMKTRTLLITILLLTVVMIVNAGGFKKNIPTDEAIEVLSGSWVNPDYDTDHYRGGRLIINLDGTIIEYKRTTSDWPNHSGNFNIDEAWKDREGNISCTLTVTDFTQPLGYWLVKISNSGKTLELVASHTGYDDYPKEIDPNDAWYDIYYRQE